MHTLKDFGFDEKYQEEASNYGGFYPARIMAQYKGMYKIITDTGEIFAKISGKFRYDTKELAQFPTVGDFVMVQMTEDSQEAIIEAVLTRRSIFLRTAVGVRGQAQSIGANIDTVFICMSLNNNYNLSRLERYLSAAWDSGATPVIILTKSDLAEDLDGMVREVEEIAAFTDVITTTMYDDELLFQLEPYLTSGTTVTFIGSSGVGKSTLINKILGQEYISTSHIGGGDKGRHTTTGREMYLSERGAILIDTPGMRELGVESADLSKSFDDIETLAQGCKFHDCSHISEPKCKVLEAIANGELDLRRLDNYQKLKIESGYDGLSAKEIEVKKLERMFKDVGGMKNVRKFMKDQKRQ